MGLRDAVDAHQGRASLASIRTGFGISEPTRKNNNNKQQTPQPSVGETETGLSWWLIGWPGSLAYSKPKTVKRHTDICTSTCTCTRCVCVCGGGWPWWHQSQNSLTFLKTWRGKFLYCSCKILLIQIYRFFLPFRRFIYYLYLYVWVCVCEIAWVYVHVPKEARLY